MTTIVVSGNEWPRVKRYLGETGLSCDLPFDFLLLTRVGAIACERKEMSDFFASLRDGRLYTEFAAMRGAAQIRILFLEGVFLYNSNDKLMISGRETPWTRKSVTNLKRSITHIEHIDIEETDDIADTCAHLISLQDYFDKSRHQSTHTRPNLVSNWLVPSDEERFYYFLQGIPTGERSRIGPSKARIVKEHLSSPEGVFNASFEQWRRVPGFGDKSAEGVYKFLHPNWTKPPKGKRARQPELAITGETKWEDL